MTIYILRVFPTPHKYWVDAEILGYFTNKRKLWRAVKKYAKALGLENWNSDAFNREFARGRIDAAGGMLETGDIESVTANFCGSIRFDEFDD